MSWSEDPNRPKRFFQRAEAVALDAAASAHASGPAATAAGEAWTVALDGRAVRTPAKAPFRAPEAVARAAAEEWAAQGERIAPESMPVTRAVNAAIDRVAPHRAAVIDDIAGYARTDLVCHRAEEPDSLIAAEAAAWDPLLAWLAEAYDARLTLAAGIAPTDQAPAALDRVRSAVAAESDIGLAALSEATAITGSVVIALALRDGRLEADAAWSASRVDEEWQIARWGRDAEADAVAERRRADLAAAARLMTLLRRN